MPEPTRVTVRISQRVATHCSFLGICCSSSKTREACGRPGSVVDEEQSAQESCGQLEGNLVKDKPVSR